MSINTIKTSIGDFPSYMLLKEETGYNLSTPLGSYPVELVKEILEHKPFYWDSNSLNWVMYARKIRTRGSTEGGDNVRWANQTVIFDLMEDLLKDLNKKGIRGNKACCEMLNRLKKEKLKRGLIG